MKIEIRLLPAAAVLAGAIAIGVGVGEALAAQPHMEAALQALQTARAELVVAAANKGGHRLKAIGYVDSAISEVQQGMAYAD